MTIRLTKLSNAEYALRDIREATMGDGTLKGASPAGYYTAPGNPPGRWIGSACRLVGGREGGEATSAQVRGLINERRDPASGRLLGDPRMEAGDQGNAPVAGWDLTATVPKSVSIMWAFADPDTRQAIDRCLDQAARMTIAYLEDEYARTRAGRGGVASVACDGLAGFQFDHWDSRDGDPHPHKHIVISNRVRRGTDGQWTALDGRLVYQSTLEVSEYHANLVRDLITRELGWSWEARQDGGNPIWEIQGVPRRLIDVFSSRDAEISGEVERRIALEEARAGRPVTDRRRDEIHRDVWLETRRAKPARQPSLADKRRMWADKKDRDAPDISIPDMIRDVNSYHGEAVRVTEDAGESIAGLVLGRMAEHGTGDGRAIEETLDRVTSKRTTWRTTNIRAEAQRVTAGVRMDPRDRIRAANEIAGQAAARCIRLTPTRYSLPEGVAGDPAIDAGGGRTVFDPPALDLYTTQDVLDAEREAMGAFDETAAAPYTHEDAARALDGWKSAHDGRLSDDQMGAAAATLSGTTLADALIGAAGTGKTTTMRATADLWRRANGPDSVMGLATSRRAVAELADSIGGGCTTIAMLRTWHSPEAARERGRERDMLRAGLADAPAAGQRLLIRQRLAHMDALDAQYSMRAGQLVVVDEAGMVDTRDIAWLARMAREAGARLLLTGDPDQLDSVSGAGGLLGWAQRTGRGSRLTTLWRFTSEAGRWARDPDGPASRTRWEQEGGATLRLRRGGDRARDESVRECEETIREYKAHGRLHWGEDPDMEELAYRMCLDWQSMGKTTLLIAGTNDQVKDMNRRFILERRARGLDEHPTGPNTIPLSDGLQATPGDQILCRRNDRSVTGPGGRRIENGMLFRVLAVRDGKAVCEALSDGDRWDIPLSFAAGHCQAGYAATVHRSQGMTVDRCAALFPSGSDVPCNLQYVAATRGREENHLLYACPDKDSRELDHRLTGAQTDPERIAEARMLAAMLSHSDTLTATETRERETRERMDLNRLIREHDHAAGLIAGPHLKAKLAERHDPGSVRAIADSPSFEWLRGTWSRAWMTDPKRALAIIGRPIRPERAGKTGEAGTGREGREPDLAALLAARLNTGLLDRVNGVVHADWAGGMVPPIRSDAHTAALDLARQNERLIELRTRELERQTRQAGPAWLGQVTNREADDPDLLRDVAAYRAMWSVDDPETPLGQQPAAPGRRAQHWANLDARLNARANPMEGHRPPLGGAPVERRDITPKIPHTMRGMEETWRQDPGPSRPYESYAPGSPA